MQEIYLIESLYHILNEFRVIKGDIFFDNSLSAFDIQDFLIKTEHSYDMLFEHHNDLDIKYKQFYKKIMILLIMGTTYKNLLLCEENGLDSIELKVLKIFNNKSLNFNDYISFFKTADGDILEELVYGFFYYYDTNYIKRHDHFKFLSDQHKLEKISRINPYEFMTVFIDNDHLEISDKEDCIQLLIELHEDSLDSAEDEFYEFCKEDIIYEKLQQAFIDEGYTKVQIKRAYLTYISEYYKYRILYEDEYYDKSFIDYIEKHSDNLDSLVDYIEENNSFWTEIIETIYETYESAKRKNVLADEEKIQSSDKVKIYQKLIKKD